MKRLIPTIFFFAAIGCCYEPSLQPAIDSAAELDRIFQHHTTNQERVVRLGNPTQETLDAYLRATMQDRTAWANVLAAHQSALAALDAGATPEQVQAILDRALDVVVILKEDQ